MKSHINWNPARLDAAVREEISKALMRMAQRMTADIRDDMLREKSGVKYKWMRVASSGPGESPAVQSGRLVSSIQVEDVSPLLKLLGTGLAYGRYLELGTRNIRPRPWLRPALWKLTVDG